jgi:hypothetical protein
MIDSYINLFNVKRNYYEGGIGITRLVLELCFIVLLIFYFITEVLEIVDDIHNK